MNTQKVNEIAKNLMQYLRDNGWNKTLKLIREMQNKDAANAKAVLKCFEDLIVDSKNGDYMYYFARDIESADLNRLLFWINERLTNYEFFGPTEEEFKRLSKYEQEISKWAQKRKKTVSAGDITDMFDNL